MKLIEHTELEKAPYRCRVQNKAGLYPGGSSSPATDLWASGLGDGLDERVDGVDQISIRSTCGAQAVLLIHPLQLRSAGGARWRLCFAPTAMLTEIARLPATPGGVSGWLRLLLAPLTAVILTPPACSGPILLHLPVVAVP